MKCVLCPVDKQLPPMSWKRLLLLWLHFERKYISCESNSLSSNSLSSNPLSSNSLSSNSLSSNSHSSNFLSSNTLSSSISLDVDLLLWSVISWHYHLGSDLLISTVPLIIEAAICYIQGSRTRKISISSRSINSSTCLADCQQKRGTQSQSQFHSRVPFPFPVLT